MVIEVAANFDQACTICINVEGKNVNFPCKCCMRNSNLNIFRSPDLRDYFVKALEPEEEITKLKKTIRQLEINWNATEAYFQNLVSISPNQHYLPQDVLNIMDSFYL